MLTYALLSPTFGMHQYTADLARRARCDLGQRARVITTDTAPAGRYAPDVELLAPISTHNTGFSAEGSDVRAYARMRRVLLAAGRDGPVHFTGVHLWNAPLAFALRRQGTHVIHTLHDLAPHSGVRRGGLIRAWNRLIIASGATILVHGECHRRQLVAEGVQAERVISAPLLHGFWGWEAEGRASAIEASVTRGNEGLREKMQRHGPIVIFFGRLEWYKGIDTLLAAWTRLGQMMGDRPGPEAPRLFLAGRLADGLTLPALPPRVELRNRRIADDEALDLFDQASLLVLPYRDATQSALVAAAARLGVPSLVTETGALPEYVTPGLTGWVVPPADPDALAGALYAALADPTRLTAMGRAAHAWYESARAQELRALASLYSSTSQSVIAAKVIA